MSPPGIADYLVTLRKPGENIGRSATRIETFPVQKWQRYASPVWMDINPSRTLQFKSARIDDGAISARCNGRRDRARHGIVE